MSRTTAAAIVCGEIVDWRCQEAAAEKSLRLRLGPRLINYHGERDRMPYRRPRDQPSPPREPMLGTVLCTPYKGTDTQSAELQHSEDFGVELQLLRNGELF